MRRVLWFVAATTWIIVLAIGTEVYLFRYEPGSQVLDGQACLLKLGAAAGNKLSFDWTGVVGERFGSHRTLWLLGKEDTLGGSVRTVQCALDGPSIRVTHPTLGMIE